MTNEEFKKIVNYIGESNIIGISFDNSSSTTFLPPNIPDAYDAEGAFSLARFYIEEIECLKIPAFDMRGNLYYSYKPISDIQCIMTTDGVTSKTKYDCIDIRG